MFSHKSINESINKRPIEFPAARTLSLPVPSTNKLGGRPTTPGNTPTPLTFANVSPSSHPALSVHHPVSPFLDPGHFSSHVLNRVISITVGLYHFSGMACYLNSAPFLYIHNRNCQSQTTIFVRPLYLSPPGLFNPVASIWLEIWGSWIGSQNSIFLGKFSKNRYRSFGLSLIKNIIP